MKEMAGLDIIRASEETLTSASSLAWYFRASAWKTTIEAMYKTRIWEMQTTIYCDPVNGNDSNTGTSKDPVKTVARANQLSSAGGSVMMLNYAPPVITWEEAFSRVSKIPVIACLHEAVDTGMRKVWCKKCDCTGVYEMGNVTWEK